jgi:hypothetical protein
MALARCTSEATRPRRCFRARFYGGLAASAWRGLIEAGPPPLARRERDGGQGLQYPNIGLVIPVNVLHVSPVGQSALTPARQT